MFARRYWFVDFWGTQLTQITHTCRDNADCITGFRFVALGMVFLCATAFTPALLHTESANKRVSGTASDCGVCS